MTANMSSRHDAHHILDHDEVINVPGQRDLLLKPASPRKEAVPGAGSHIISPRGLVSPYRTTLQLAGL